MDAYLDLRQVAEKQIAADPHCKLYFLLDHSGLPGLSRRLAQSSVEWVSLFAETQERGLTQVSPILVLVTANGALKIGPTLFKWISEKGTYASSIMILASPLDIDRIKSRLTYRLAVRLSENMDGLLRFFDPRVFESLLDVLTCEQKAWFLSLASKWWFVNRSGRLIRVDNTFCADEQLNPPLQLSQSQEFELIDRSETDLVLSLLRANAPTILATLSISDQYDFVQRAVKAAKRAGVTSTTHVAAYVVIALSNGEDFFNGSSGKCALADLIEDPR